MGTARLSGQVWVGMLLKLSAVSSSVWSVACSIGTKCSKMENKLPKCWNLWQLETLADQKRRLVMWTRYVDQQAVNMQQHIVQVKVFSKQSHVVQIWAWYIYIYVFIHTCAKTQDLRNNATPTVIIVLPFFEYFPDPSDNKYNRTYNGVQGCCPHDKPYWVYIVYVESIKKGIQLEQKNSCWKPNTIDLRLPCPADCSSAFSMDADTPHRMWHTGWAAPSPRLIQEPFSSMAHPWMGWSVGLVLLFCIMCSDTFEFSQLYSWGLCF